MKLKVISKERVKGQPVWGHGNDGYGTGLCKLERPSYLVFKFVLLAGLLE